MNTTAQSKPASLDSIPPGKFLLRVLWIAIELIAVYWLARQGELFFYQGF